MNKWFYLFIVWFCWCAAGVMILRADGNGAETGFDQFESPARIVSMAPNLTEILFALGLDEKIVGVTRDSNYPPAAMDKPTSYQNVKRSGLWVSIFSPPAHAGRVVLRLKVLSV